MIGQPTTDVVSPQARITVPDPVATDEQENRSIFASNKTQLAIGVAATLGILIYYNWQEKNLSKKDPEAYARLQRFKSLVRADRSHVKSDIGENIETQAQRINKPAGNNAR
jgi:uncharacterized protein HemX